MNIPNRKEYLQHQAQNGQRIMGVLPALYPKELLWAFDILAVELWDPPGEILQANAHLQASICPVVKRSLEFILKEPQIINAGYLFPHTCDSLQNLATQVKDLIGVPVPVYTFYNPKGTFNKTTQKYYEDILANFKTSLEIRYGELDPLSYLTACELGLKIDARRLELHNARMKDQLALNNLEYFQIVRAAEFLKPAEYLELLRAVDISDQPMGNQQVRVLISGILPPNNEMLAALDELGVSIVAEDLLAGSRRIPIVQMDKPESPESYLTDRFFLLPPCSTRGGSLIERLEHLKKLIRASNSQGVIFNIVKFCEPELFDHRMLVKSLKALNIPILSLETELQPGVSGQEKTRVEAFVERLLDAVNV